MTYLKMARTALLPSRTWAHRFVSMQPGIAAPLNQIHPEFKAVPWMPTFRQHQRLFPRPSNSPHQPTRKKVFRPKKIHGSRSDAEIVNEQHNLQSSNFPTLPATGTVQAPVDLTSAPSQQMIQANGDAPHPSVQVAGNVSPNSSLSSDSAKNQRAHHHCRNLAIRKRCLT